MTTVITVQYAAFVHFFLGQALAKIVLFEVKNLLDDSCKASPRIVKPMIVCGRQRNCV